MPFRLTAFGELSLHDTTTGRQLAVPRKAMAMLAVLAATRPGKGVARDWLLALLWPEVDDSGRGALKQTIYALRQTLGARDVIVGRTELTLDTSLITSDVADFDAACTASN